MSTRLYYYTGTGNSLWVARQLAGRLDGEVELVSLGADYELPGADCDRIGLVFPVHMWGLPQHVRDFAARLPAAPGRVAVIQQLLLQITEIVIGLLQRGELIVKLNAIALGPCSN